VIAPAADVGVFGGSGLYELLPEAEEIEVDSPFGEASASVSIATIGAARVAFLPRHGAGHRVPPHRVNYRANVDVMRRLGVRAIVSPFAAGSLQPTIHPGDLVVVDQFVDRTSGRADTFHDSFENGPQHVSLADPYDPALRALTVEVARELGHTVHDGGTVVVVNGPRFSTRAESQWFRAAGWHLVNMTQYPEVALACEAGIPIAGLALVTDYDAGIEGRDHVPVSQEAVFALFEANVAKVRDVLLAIVARIVL
jgi:5'-methylthioadenosine phosphorylase